GRADRLAIHFAEFDRTLFEIDDQQAQVLRIRLEGEVEDVAHHRYRAQTHVQSPIAQHAHNRPAPRTQPARFQDDVETQGAGEGVAHDRHKPDEPIETEPESEYRELTIQTLLELSQLRAVIAFLGHQPPPAALFVSDYRAAIKCPAF